ncbi:MAG: zeta toxin family protein [Actinomycetota bacterium]
MNDSAFNYHRYYLSEQDSERIFQTDIVPGELAGALSVDEPIVVFITGQPGAGKTKLTTAFVDSLEAVGGSVSINSDTYKPHHPMWNELLRRDDTTAAPYTAADGRRWMAKAEQYATEHRMNIVLETTMRDAGVFTDPARRLAEAGYRVEVAALAVPAASSRLGIIARYQQQVRDTGAGRLTEVSNHDACFDAVYETLTTLDQTAPVDAISVWRRDSELLYGNTRGPNGQWAAPAAAALTLATERSRAWSYPVAIAFTHELEELRGEVTPALRAQLDDIHQLAGPLLPPGSPAAATAARSFPEVINPLQRNTSIASHHSLAEQGRNHLPQANQGVGR